MGTHPGVRGLIPFLKGISLKVNIIALMMLELTYFDIRVLHVGHHTMGTYSGFRGLIPVLKGNSLKGNIIA